MDACYGRNLVGYSWADDDDDDFDMEAFQADAANYEYYGSSTSEQDKVASDGDYDEHDIPPRPATPEPTFRRDGGDDDDEYELPPRPSTPDPELPADTCDWRMPPSDDAAPSEAPQAHAYPYKKLPCDPAFYLQTPFPLEYHIPPGLPPNTLHYLEYSGPWKPAYEELMWEGAGSYAGGYRNIKVQRKADCRRIVQLFGSPLRQEVTYEEEDAGDDYRDELELEEAICRDEAGVIEKWEIGQDDAKTGKTFDVYRDGDEMEKEVGEELAHGAQESDAATAVVTSSPTIVALEDELAHEAPKTEGLDSASANEGCKLKKRDSVHEAYDMELFPDNESLSSSTTPESSVIVSTDDEIEMVKDSRFVLPLDEPFSQEDDKEDDMCHVLSSNTMEEQQEDKIKTFFFSAKLLDWSPLAADVTVYGKDLPSRGMFSVTPTTHIKGLKNPVLKGSAAVEIIRSIASPDSVPTSTPPQARKEEDISRRLNTLYRIHNASRKHCRRFGSGILYALAHLPMA